MRWTEGSETLSTLGWIAAANKASTSAKRRSNRSWMPLACLANGWKRSEGEAPDFTARVEEVAVDDRGDEVLSHIDGAEQALRAGRVIDAHEHIQAARRALGA
jgi:hypothetical protein